MIIKLLGTGCPNCKKLEENTKQALTELEKEAEIIKITELKEIMNFGILSLPAIIVDDEVKAYGKVNSVNEIKKMID